MDGAQNRCHRFPLAHWWELLVGRHWASPLRLIPHTWCRSESCWLCLPNLSRMLPLLSPSTASFHVQVTIFHHPAFYKSLLADLPWPYNLIWARGIPKVLILFSEFQLCLPPQGAEWPTCSPLFFLYLLFPCLGVVVYWFISCVCALCLRSVSPWVHRFLFLAWLTDSIKTHRRHSVSDGVMTEHIRRPGTLPWVVLHC